MQPTEQTTLSRVAALRIDRTLIERALEKSPTGGNSKPFSWSWSGEALVIKHDAKLAEHYLNRNHHTSWIALGCLLTSVEIAAKAQGFGIEFSTKEAFDPSENNHGPNSTIHFARLADSNISDEAVRNLQALLGRQTYRGPLAPSAAPAFVPTGSDGVSIRLISTAETSKTTKEYITAADSYLWIQKQATRDFFKEVTFSATPQGPKDRGIRIGDLGINKADQMMLRFLSRATWLPSLMAQVPGLNASFKAVTKRTLKNAHLLLVSAKNLNPEELIRVGQETLRAWIELEKQGYRLQPLSMASITLIDAATGVLPGDTKSMFRRLFEDIGPAVLRRQFGLATQEKPVWLLRVGVPQK